MCLLCKFYLDSIYRWVSKPDYTQDWENRITTYGYTLKPIMRMVAVRFPDTIQKRSELTNLASALHQLFPGSIYFIQDDLILLPRADEHAQKQKEGRTYCPTFLLNLL